MASQPIYQFYSELKGCRKPKVWRRFQVAANISMARLGYILMTLYEMQASHLFCLTVPERENARLDTTYARAEPDIWEPYRRFAVDAEGLPPIRDEVIYEAPMWKLRGVLRGNPGEKLTLTYDFGDEWEVEAALEAVLVDRELPGRELPRILDGAGYGILEDCGGPFQLERIARAFREKSGEDYKKYQERLGMKDLDLHTFDLADMNLRLKKVPRIYEKLYEWNEMPSQKSMDFLERKYRKRDIPDGSSS